jgi:hypothetical protein
MQKLLRQLEKAGGVLQAPHAVGRSLARFVVAAHGIPLFLSFGTCEVTMSVRKPHAQADQLLASTTIAAAKACGAYPRPS